MTAKQKKITSVHRFTVIILIFPLHKNIIFYVCIFIFFFFFVHLMRVLCIMSPIFLHNTSLIMLKQFAISIFLYSSPEYIARTAIIFGKRYTSRTTYPTDDTINFNHIRKDLALLLTYFLQIIRNYVDTFQSNRFSHFLFLTRFSIVVFVYLIIEKNVFFFATHFFLFVLCRKIIVHSTHTRTQLPRTDNAQYIV